MTATLKILKLSQSPYLIQSVGIESLNLKKARKALKDACEQNNPQRAKQALLNWAAIRWPDMYNLGNVAAQLSDTKIKAVLRDLDRVLYTPPQETAWEGKAFWQLMDKTPTGEVENSPLPMLYPETLLKFPVCTG
jgi:hypothetical protein